MKFTLTYNGSLPSSGNKPKNKAKSDIRQVFHPQLKELWDSNPALLDLGSIRFFPKNGAGLVYENHHDFPQLTLPPNPLEVQNGNILDLCKPFDKHGVWCQPLVRNSFALHCGLKILFLRKEKPGKIYQGGDLDGRLKTLIDALSMPQHREQVTFDNMPATATEPLHCLVEDDALISGLNIASERLYGRDNQDIDYVALTIEVDIRVRQPKLYNQSFL